MKRYLLPALLCLSGIIVSINVNSVSIIYPRSTTSIVKDWKNLKISEFIMLSPEDYTKITGKKMNLTERISFSIMKLRMKHVIRKNPNMTVSEYMDTHKKLGTGWWILIGFGIAIVFLILLALALSAGSKGCQTG
jgi:hypothetical protein